MKMSARRSETFANSVVYETSKAVHKERLETFSTWPLKLPEPGQYGRVLIFLQRPERTCPVFLLWSADGLVAKRKGSMARA